MQSLRTGRDASSPGSGSGSCGDPAAENLADMLLGLELLDAVHGGDLAGQPLEGGLVELAFGVGRLAPVVAAVRSRTTSAIG